MDEESAEAADGEVADAAFRYKQRLASIYEQIAREGPAREWAAGRQLLDKLLRRLARLDRVQARRPHPECVAAQEITRARIAELEEVDEHPPDDPELWKRAEDILQSRRDGCPPLRGIGLHPGGDLARKREVARAFGLAGLDDLELIDAQRIYRLRALTRSV